MTWYLYLTGAITLLAAVALIIVVILQEGNSKGVGVVSGGADSFFSKNKARSIDAFLSRWTKFFAIGFFILIIAMNVLNVVFTSTPPVA
ncbi:MAG: preprotein translocase subunit SecG [Ruminococcus sp.]|nr:preprotein translocase subunit SecG [Ruminococcus sp.]